MKITIIPFVIGAFGTVTKGLLKGLEDLKVDGRVETIQWEWPEYWEESWRLEETCCHSNSREKPSVYTDAKNSKRVNDNKIPGSYKKVKKNSLLFVFINAFNSGF